jgi:hypothetical protein
LQQLRDEEIEPGRVIFMASGVEIVFMNKYGTGVNQDFAMCTGEELFEIGKQYNPKNSPQFPISTEPNVYGYVYGMCEGK